MGKKGTMRDSKASLFEERLQRVVEGRDFAEAIEEEIDEVQRRIYSDELELNKIELQTEDTIERERAKVQKESELPSWATSSLGAQGKQDYTHTLRYWNHGKRRKLDEEKEYLSFLKEKQSGLLKNTRPLFANEKYAYLELMGLFDTEVWKGMLEKTTSDERERLISELLGCDIDTARHIMNGRNAVNKDKKVELQDRVNQLSKGA